MSEPLLPFQIEVVPDDDTMTARAGLPLVVETGRALGLYESVTRHVHVRQRRSGLSEADKVEDLVMLLADGGDCLDDLDAFSVRRQRGVVPAERDHLQRAQRGEVTGVAAVAADGAAQAAAAAVFVIAGRIVTHAGRLVLHIGRSAEQLAGLIAARERLPLLRAQCSTA